MKKVTITYTNGSEVVEIEALSNASAIVEALRLANLKARKTGVYKTVTKVEVSKSR